MKNKPLYKISRSGLFAAIICVCAFICIPIGPVPVTAALIAVMLSGVVLSPLEAVAATLVYVVMGALGLPVFSGGGGGIGILLGPTGGYIWSYPLLALVASLFTLINIKSKRLNYLTAFAGCIAGTAVCYLCGTLQYMAVCNTSFATALITCIIPFIPFDIIKSLIAILIGIPLKKRI